MSATSDNSRIAKNTLFLYIRMAVIMIVKLYTSRVLLQVLGIDNYGVWNAVAAFVIAFSFISNPLVTATQRFLNFDMARGGKKQSEIFTTSLQLFTAVSLVIVLLLETIGLWIVNTKMDFAPVAMTSVHVLYHFSVITLVVNLIRMTYESAIIAEERMSFYAGACVLEALLLLAIAFIVRIDFGLDKLAAYGLLYLISSLFILGCYMFYCHRHFPYTKIRDMKFRYSHAKEIASFTGWNLLGATASMSATQGVTTLINIFFGVVVNAAYGVAVQVQNAVSNIIFNLNKAANPQIVKSYAGGDLDRTRFLVNTVCKACYVLSLLFALPLIFNIEFVLHLWLGNTIPPLAPRFSSLFLVLLLLVSFSGTMDTAILATGKIKKFQIVYSLIIFLNIIFVYICFKLGFKAYYAILIKIMVECIILTARLVFLTKYIHLRAVDFLTKTILPCFILTLSGITIFVVFDNVTSTFGWTKLLLSTAVYLPSLAILAWFIAANKSQRLKIINLISARLGHF